MSVEETNDGMELLERTVRNMRHSEEAKKAIDTALVRGFLVLPPNIRADKKLLAGRVFFAQLALKPRYEPDDSVDTACTDGKTVYYNPAFIVTLTHEQVVGLVAHEVLHDGFLHQARCGPRDHG